MTTGRRVSDKQARDDHDLLVRIDAKVEGLVSLMAVKADAQSVASVASDVADHEKRMRELERRVVMAAGALFAVQVLLTFYVAFGK